MPLCAATTTPFTPPLHLRGGILQTVRSNLVARALPPLPSAERRVFRAPDGEPLVARVTWQPGRRRDAPAAVLVHGLEGSAESPYVRGTAAKLFDAGWHVVRLNQRGCGESEGLTATLHHGGRGEDVAAVLEALGREDGVERLAAVGFSLGGALVLKMLGDLGASAPRGLVAAAALSPLLNPAHVQAHLDRPASLPYRRFFLRLMAAHLRRRAALHPGRFPAGERFESDRVERFDDLYTAPLCGFASAQDYYRRADALPGLRNVRVPTLLVHAQDDPVVPFAGLTPAHRRDCPAVRFVFPETGGHLGFYQPAPGTDGYWAEDRAVEHLTARARPERRAA